MMRFLCKLLNIRQQEWPRVALLFLIYMLTDSVAIVGTTVAYAALLKQVGIGTLPWVLGISSLISIVIIAMYTAFVDRMTHDRLMIAIYAFYNVGLLLGLVLIWFKIPWLAYPLLYLLDHTSAPVF